MNFKTLWGYELVDVCGLPDILSAEDFDFFTARKYAGDIRIPKELEAASAAIRNYCGWHLYPSLPCKLTMTMQDRRVTRTGVDLLIQLPAKYVTAVESVTIGGTEYEYTFETNGILRVYDVRRHSRRDEVVVEYTAGLPKEMMGTINELAAHSSTRALASSGGVTNETAGGVSITYNANWVANARATALPDDGKEALAPFRCQGVF